MPKVRETAERSTNQVTSLLRLSQPLSMEPAFAGAKDLLQLLNIHSFVCQLFRLQRNHESLLGKPTTDME